MPSRSLLIVVLALLGLAASTTAGAQTVINSVPYTISVSGKYVLGNNLITSSASQIAITINAPNVILDLDGFFVSGPGGVTNSTQPVISIGNVSNVTIRNGTVANNGYGILFVGGSNASNYLVENVNVTRCYLVGISLGVFVGTATPGSLVRNNTLSNIGGTTASSNSNTRGIQTSGGTSVEGNLISTVTAPGTGVAYGIDAAGTDFAVGNKISLCDVGIRMATGGKYLNNLTSNCTTAFSGGTSATGNN